jgi:hypothetical protein
MLDRPAVVIVIASGVAVPEGMRRDGDRDSDRDGPCERRHDGSD